MRGLLLVLLLRLYGVNNDIEHQGHNGLLHVFVMEHMKSVGR